MEDFKVYSVTVGVSDTYGKLNIRLLFPSARMRRQFCKTHRAVCVRIGRRPIIAVSGDLERTRMNIAHYEQLSDFIPVWDAEFTLGGIVSQKEGECNA